MQNTFVYDMKFFLTVKLYLFMYVLKYLVEIHTFSRIHHDVLFSQD